jgi:dTMP kinase
LIEEEAGLGFFISFEGVEGCGKTTQMEMLKDHLEWKGKRVLAVREPGGTELGEKIRAILLNVEREKELYGDEKSIEGLDPWAELMLYEACRAQVVKKVINPALDEGKVVLCDRYTDSTLSYQGFGRGLDMEAIRSLNRWASMGVVPDITFVLDCSPEVGLKRAVSRIESKGAGPREDRFENEAIEFHERVRQGYLKLAAEEPVRIKLIDGEREIAVIHKEICDIMEKMEKIEKKKIN